MALVVLSPLGVQNALVLLRESLSTDALLLRTRKFPSLSVNLP